MSVKRILNGTWKFTKSKSLAVFLITAITILVTIDVFLLADEWVPVKPGQATQTGIVYTYWWFQALIVLLLFNLAACIASSTIRRFSRGQLHLGLWGSTFFHLGLAVILIGTLLTGHYREVATVKLIHGEAKEIPYRAFTTDSDEWLQEQDKISFTLQQQNFELNDSGEVKDTLSVIGLGEQGQITLQKEVGERQQISYRGLYMFPSAFGYAVEIRLENTQGDEVAQVVIPMETTEYGEGVKSFSKNGYRFDPLPHLFSFNFYPDIGTATGNSVLINKSMLLNNPGLLIVAQDGQAASSQKVLRLNESMALDKYKLTFAQAKPWTLLSVLYDPGANWVFVGMIIGIGGLSLFMILHTPKRKM